MAENLKSVWETSPIRKWSQWSLDEWVNNGSDQVDVCGSGPDDDGWAVHLALKQPPCAWLVGVGLGNVYELPWGSSSSKLCM